jgi:hypothetical protein
MLAIAAGAFAVACCAGLPAIVALIGGITIAAVVGVAGGALALAAVTGGAALLVHARRRRRSCSQPARGLLG